MNQCSKFCLLCQFSLLTTFSQATAERGLPKDCLAHTDQVDARFLFMALFVGLYSIIFYISPNAKLEGNIHHPIHSCAYHASDRHLCPGLWNSAPDPMSSCFDKCVTVWKPRGLLSHTTLFAPWTLLSGWYLRDQYVLWHRICLFSIRLYLGLGWRLRRRSQITVLER